MVSLAVGLEAARSFVQHGRREVAHPFGFPATVFLCPKQNAESEKPGALISLAAGNRS